MRKMSTRSTIATLSLALILGFGAAEAAVPAAAIPPVAPSAPTEPGDYPLNGQGTSPKNAPGAEKNEQAEKTENLGGGLATEIIDLVTGAIKCGLNIATDSVPCPL